MKATKRSPLAAQTAMAVEATHGATTLHHDKRRPQRSRSEGSDSAPERLYVRGMRGARLRLMLGLAAIFGSLCIAGLALAYYGNDANLSVGYSPEQPVEFSHKLHAGDLGLDCRFCHFTVERSAFAAIPTTQVCMNCHNKIRTDSIKLLPVRATYAERRPIAWVRVHNLPDFAYFDHATHLAAGVGCSTCHGRVDQMLRVEQVESLSMGWCLGCHRNPAPYLRKPADITAMSFIPNWRPTDSPAARPMSTSGQLIEPALHCSGCHR